MKMLQNMTLDDKVFNELWDDMQNLVETIPDPTTFVALISENNINKRILRYLRILGYKIMLICTARKN